MSFINTRSAFIFVFFVIVCVYFFVKNSSTTIFFTAPPPNKSIFVGTPKIVLTADQHLTDRENDKPISIKPAKNAQPPALVGGSPAQQAELINWFISRGYSRFDSNSPYKSYDEQTLKKLADNGDIIAMDLLADIYLDEVHIGTYGFDAASALYKRAALYGSTDAFYKLAQFEKILNYQNAKTPEDKRNSILEVLALYNVAELRGDKWPNFAMAESVINIEQLNLSSDDRKKINDRSHEIYNKLQEQRIALGLGEFDNSVPDSAKRYFDILINESKI